MTRSLPALLYDVGLDDMTLFFYVQAYNALIETARGFIETLDAAGISGRTGGMALSVTPELGQKQAGTVGRCW